MISKLKLQNKLFSRTFFNFSEKIFMDPNGFQQKNKSRPRTLNDIKKIQNFIKTKDQEGKLGNVFEKSATAKDEFNEFFKEFKEKNKNKWASIINGMDISPEELKKELNNQKDDELTVIQEMQRRNRLKAAYKAFDDLGREEENEINSDPTKSAFDHPYKEENLRGLRTSQDGYELAKDPLNVSSYLAPDPRKNEYFNPSEFHLIFMDSDMICNMTRLNRVYSRRVLLYMGNKDGLISYGIGKGTLYEDAWIAAYQDLRRNLILINVDIDFTVPTPIKARFHDYRLQVKSSKNPRYWGNPIMALMLRYAGLYHFGFSIISRVKDPYAMTFAFFKTVTQNTTPKDLGELHGEKLHKIFNGRPKKYELSHDLTES